MAPGAQIDYDALASQSGGAPAVNYDALAGQYGGAPSQPVAPPPTDDQIPAPPESVLSTAANAVGNLWPNLIKGAGHEAAKTYSTLSKFSSAMPGFVAGGGGAVPEIPAVTNYGEQPQEGLEQKAGGIYENILEFMMGDEALKGLSLADKLKAVQPVIKVAEKFPNVAKALSGAARTGTVSGAQTAAKGGTPEEIGKNAVAGAALGGVVEGGAGKLADTIAEKSPVVSQVGDQEFVTPKPAQVPPEVQQAQTAGKNVIAKTATEAAQRNVIQDVPSTIAKVQSFGEAADQVEKSAKDAYANLNQTTNGKFSQVRDDFNKARKDVWTAIGPEERDAAQGRLDNATAAMRQLFEETDGKVTQQDWKDANSAWNNAKTLRQVHNAVESTFDTDAGFSQRSGTYRGFNGNQLRANLNRLTQKIGEPELNRVIGRDNMDNLRKVAELTRTNSDRAKFGAAVQRVGGWLARDSAAAGVGALVGHAAGVGGWMGAAAGEASLMAARKVMQMVATNPRIGQQLTFAVESGARPEYYAPLIGKMIRDAEEEGKQQ